MYKNAVHRVNIIGAGEVGNAISVDMDKNNIHKTNSSFWDTKGNEVIGTTALPKYGAFVSEEKCHLFGDVSGKKLLEICCGTGHSLSLKKIILMNLGILYLLMEVKYLYRIVNYQPM